MAFGVLIHRSDSIYEDTPAERYHFPALYLSRMQPLVGGWIIYLEPSKVAQSKGYFALAKVQQIIPDPSRSGMYFALIEPGSYLDFATPVPFNGPDGIVERGVLNERGCISGRAQAAVRTLSRQDFDRIVDLGLDQDGSSLSRVEEFPAYAFEEPQASFETEKTDRVRALTSRLVRDRVFRRVVLRAYDERCAITGLKLINGGGRAEVEAAHIRAVEAKGPDIVTNGIALSGTAHWMFDRGLISLGDDLEILISRQVNDRDGVLGLINKSGQALLPRREVDRPHPHFLNWHRENRFKG